MRGGADEAAAGEVDLAAALYVLECKATRVHVDESEDSPDMVVIDLTGVRDGEVSTEHLLVRVDALDSLHQNVLDAVGRRIENERERRWARFTGRLECAIGALDDDEFLVLHTPHGRFVQLLAGDGQIRAETVSNQCLPEHHHLPIDQLDALDHLRWHAPTHRMGDDPGPRNGSPNHWLEFDDDTPVDVLASLLVATLRLVHRVTEPEDLTYQCADLSGRRIVVPTLGLSRTPDPM